MDVQKLVSNFSMSPDVNFGKDGSYSQCFKDSQGSVKLSFWICSQQIIWMLKILQRTLKRLLWFRTKSTELSAFYADTASLMMGKHKRVIWFLQKKTKTNGDYNVEFACPLTQKNISKHPFLDVREFLNSIFERMPKEMNFT